jgi:glutathione S-transferase
MRPMKLIGSRTSPYVRKARVFLAEKRRDYEFVEENVWAAATQVGRYNPLTKVPVLVLDDGTSLFDSSVITEYADTLGAPVLIPAAGLERALARRAESLADGICDAAVSIVLERKRDPQRQDPAAMDRARAKVDAGIAFFAGQIDGREWLDGAAPGLSDIAAGCALLYVEFRLPEVGWRSQHPALARWAERLEARPSFAATRPPAA